MRSPVEIVDCLHMQKECRAPLQRETRLVPMENGKEKCCLAYLVGAGAGVAAGFFTGVLGRVVMPSLKGALGS